MEKWYILEAMQGAAASKERRIEEISYEDVFGRTENDPDRPISFAGIFDRLLERAGGMDSLTSEQLEAIEAQARAEASRLQAEKEIQDHR